MEEHTITAIYGDSHEMDEELQAGLDITPNDVKKALGEQGVDPTLDNIEKACLRLEGLARDFAQAVLQDEKDWKVYLKDESLSL